MASGQKCSQQYLYLLIFMVLLGIVYYLSMNTNVYYDYCGNSVSDVVTGHKYNFSEEIVYIGPPMWTTFVVPFRNRAEHLAPFLSAIHNHQEINLQFRVQFQNFNLKSR
jgi:hypothetical protein